MMTSSKGRLVNVYLVLPFIYVLQLGSNFKLPFYRIEKFEPEKVSERLVMDTSAMEEAWKRILKKEYSLLNYNCVDAVLEVLQAGNAKFSAIVEGEDDDDEDEFKTNKVIRKIFRKIGAFKSQAFRSALNRFSKKQ